MTDVVEKLRASYESRTTAVDADAIVERAIARGSRIRRARRGTAVGSSVAVIVLVVTLVVAAARPDTGVRVGTRPTAAPRGVPTARVSMFPDLARMQKLAVSNRDRAAQPALVRAEVVKTTWGAFRTSATPVVSDDTPDDLAIDVIQLTGTTFTCGCSLAPMKPGRALLYEWDPSTHGVRSFAFRREPIDLWQFGRVYRIPLPPVAAPPTTVARDLCTQADLDAPGLAMPAPQRITKTTALGDFGRLDPAPGVVSRVPATTAWQALTGGHPQPARSARLLLGYYSSSPSAGGHVLAWVLEEQHLAFDGFQGPGPPPPGVTTTPRPACEFTNAYLVLDAITGKGITDAYRG
ncbi:MAG TPA: hypothetical protein VH914_16240 [Acidimicrobiia bacterium]|nr:hypothetical protein [Acidimicrobiia bacterium]